MRGEEETCAALHIRLICLHEHDALIKRLSIERIDLVIAHGNLARADRIGINQRQKYAVELCGGELANLWEVQVTLQCRLWRQLLRHLRHRRGMVGDALALKTAGGKGSCDGLKIDRAGNLWATGPGGVLVISPSGKHLGTLATGVSTANCGWGDDGSTLYITANNMLLRVKTKTKGAGW